MLLSVPFFYWLHEESYDFYRYTKYALRRFAETTGFEVVLIKELGGAPEMVVEYFFKMHLEVGRPIGKKRCGCAPGGLSNAGGFASRVKDIREDCKLCFPRDHQYEYVLKKHVVFWLRSVPNFLGKRLLVSKIHSRLATLLSDFYGFLHEFPYSEILADC